jgi:two-component system, NtrC family, sensor histidine kinase KinB
MRLQTKLLLAQLPLLVGLAVSGYVGSSMMTAVGLSSERILHENYRSVLAVQRMKEAAERIDSGALFIVAGHGELGNRQIEVNTAVFER